MNSSAAAAARLLGREVVGSGGASIGFWRTAKSEKASNDVQRDQMSILCSLDAETRGGGISECLGGDNTPEITASLLVPEWAWLAHPETRQTWILSEFQSFIFKLYIFDTIEKVEIFCLVPEDISTIIGLGILVV